MNFTLNSVIHRDWLVGMNATCYYSLLHGDNGKALSVGRVVTPTMEMVVEREKEIEEFVPETYYTVNLNVGGAVFKSRHFKNEEEVLLIAKKSNKPLGDRINEYR